MTHPEKPNINPEYPFKHNKIPVADGLDGFVEFAKKFPGFTFCPYVAEKDDEGWDKSTSRVYMNQVLPRFLYVPVNVAKNDLDGLGEFFRSMQGRLPVKKAQQTNLTCGRWCSVTPKVARLLTSARTSTSTSSKKPPSAAGPPTPATA